MLIKQYIYSYVYTKHFNECYITKLIHEMQWYYTLTKFHIKIYVKNYFLYIYYNKISRNSSFF